jgi:hypothetical protein
MLSGSTQQDISDMTSALIAPGTSMSGSQLAGTHAYTHAYTHTYTHTYTHPAYLVLNSPVPSLCARAIHTECGGEGRGEASSSNLSVTASGLVSPSSPLAAAAGAVAGNEADCHVPMADTLSGLAAASEPDDKTTLPSPPRAPSDWDADGECVVCLERRAQVAVIPCGHVCLCAECAQQQVLCPICRAHVCGTLRVFFPASH